MCCSKCCEWLNSGLCAWLSHVSSSRWLAWSKTTRWRCTKLKNNRLLHRLQSVTPCRRVKWPTYRGNVQTRLFVSACVCVCVFVQRGKSTAQPLPEKVSACASRSSSLYLLDLWPGPWLIYHTGQLLIPSPEVIYPHVVCTCGSLCACLATLVDSLLMVQRLWDCYGPLNGYYHLNPPATHTHTMPLHTTRHALGCWGAPCVLFQENVLLKPCLYGGCWPSCQAHIQTHRAVRTHANNSICHSWPVKGMLCGRLITAFPANSCRICLRMTVCLSCNCVLICFWKQ